MANTNIIGPELEENQQPPTTPARCILNQFFASASTPFTAICNQLLPQDVLIRYLERELDINHSPIPSDITSTPSDREPHIGLSSGGHQNEENEDNEERPIGIAEINEEASKDNIDSADDTNANEEEAESEENNNSDSSEKDSSEEAESEEENDSDLSEASSEILF